MLASLNPAGPCYLKPAGTRSTGRRTSPGDYLFPGSCCISLQDARPPPWRANRFPRDRTARNLIHASLWKLFICTTTSCWCLEHMRYSELRMAEDYRSGGNLYARWPGEPWGMLSMQHERFSFQSEKAWSNSGDWYPTHQALALWWKNVL